VLLLALLSLLVQLGLVSTAALAEPQEITLPTVHSSGSVHPATPHRLVNTHFASTPGPFDVSLVKATTLPNLSPGRDWPSPVDDAERRTMVLVDVLEYRPQTRSTGSQSDYRWDIEGWYGGDYNRVWFKTEGQRNTAFKADYDVDFQLLYGRFMQKYYDFQIGGRVETQTFRGANVTRGLAVIGIEGLVPYSYQIEPSLFIDQNGAVSARLAATKDLLMTQRLILQLRLETNAAVQRVEEFTTGSGLNNVEFGVRLRYDIRRGFSPYVGVSFDRSFGETATLIRQEGGSPSQVRFAMGIRMWF
jgi:copper resistance protein B